ncbi:hypothetical protein PHYBLDRAFT_69234 [Phycomyces blakesleeanus NRRL 1555(-)]|uniref:Uncharacterized protein n=1 Tax=Phycomyces blakesleeanus (strain ATCC 8743b / DSM 1359 / FGSC 10004 / NBRC 33097 / NRRL 1555) TaxID=763407 RepID=A0A162TFF4_PHYB8|nr:hypothetical protein PHYBLDRAFT_69234 [Phycomyces blakesleeanus NRRL 1555(-)]OAD68162.1 hypothetical protein PHYBLDRAFT_69234 [Phycomyces blakesleeanus NRRL 1555(-)]|eukprot:XP_018286202.1 hypothetical protein PHYBLDRAFT_69234 [Phycomyces blakesleeanus NRRL 1555(-)]
MLYKIHRPNPIFTRTEPEEYTRTCNSAKQHHQPKEEKEKKRLHVLSYIQADNDIIIAKWLNGSSACVHAYMEGCNRYFFWSGHLAQGPQSLIPTLVLHPPYSET